MKNNSILAIVGVVLLLLVVGGIVFSQSGKSDKEKMEDAVADYADEMKDSQSNNKEESGGNAFSGTLKKAIELGVPMKCSYKVGEMEAEGYVKGRNYAGKMEMNGKLGQVIMKENCMWSWDDSSKQGIKMCMEEVEGESIWDDPKIDNPDMNFNCHPVVVSGNAFDLPSDVNFMDLDQMMNQ